MEMYDYFLDNVQGIGEKTIQRLLERFGNSYEAYRASPKALATVLGERQQEQFRALKSSWDVEARYLELKQKDIRFISVLSKEYPQRLLEIPDRPFALYVKGKLPRDEVPTVAMIGARRCSAYGKYIACEFGSQLAKAGVQVVSGLAMGIDGISQNAVFEAGGETFGVLGCGVDVCYPSSHKELYEKVIKTGGILSTYPVGTAPKPTQFPPRNRIISGLADAILVVEARQKSGTLITVDMALEQGRDIYCIPGRLTDRLSDGCNGLLQQGAGVVLSPKDLLSKLPKLGAGREQRESMLEREAMDLTNKERSVWMLLDYYPISLDQLRMNMAVVEQLKEISLQETMYILLQLTLKGKVENNGGNYYTKKA